MLCVMMGVVVIACSGALQDAELQDDTKLSDTLLFVELQGATLQVSALQSIAHVYIYGQCQLHCGRGVHRVARLCAET